MIIKTCRVKNCSAYGVILQGKKDREEVCPGCGDFLINIPHKRIKKSKRQLFLNMGGVVINEAGETVITCEDNILRGASLGKKVIPHTDYYVVVVETTAISPIDTTIVYLEYYGNDITRAKHDLKDVCLYFGLGNLQYDH